MRALLWWLFLPALVWLAMVIRQHPLVEAGPVYRTCAKLLISPGSRGSDFEFNPMTGPRSILELTRDQELLERVVQRSGVAIHWMELRSQMQVSTSGHLADKVDMLEITLVGPDPDRLQRLAACLVHCLIERMRQLTVVEQDRALIHLKREYQRAQQQFEHSWRQLEMVGGQGNRMDRLRLAQLESARTRLEGDLRRLELEVTNPSPPEALLAEVERERLALAALRNVYLERSPLVRTQSERLGRLHSWLSKTFRERLEQSQRLRRVRLSCLQGQLRKVDTELARLRRKQPALRQILRSMLMQREMQMWQGNVQALQRQLMEARFAREKRAAGLTVVVVQKPQRGARIALPSARRQAWQRWLHRLPESLFLGLLLSFAIHYLCAQLKVEKQIEEAMGLPVLGRIPSMSGELCRDWERIKHARTQGPDGGI